MRCPRWSALTLTLLIFSVALGAGDQVALERNRQMLARWRSNPDHIARLQRDMRVFHALPRARQEQLRTLDQQLHETNPTTQARLWAALERYNAWLATRTDEQRLHITQAPDAATRLARIRELRLREWKPRLTTSDQQTVARLPVDQQPGRIAALRFEDRRQRGAWYRAWLADEAAVPRPTSLKELPAETRAFVEANLMKRLIPVERDKLRKAEGKYPEWFRLLDALSEVHPVLPPLPSGEVKSFDDLVKIRGLEDLKKPDAKLLLGRLKGPWPEFALKARYSLKEKQFPPLGASKPSEFSPEIQKFLTQKLFPTLGREQRIQLDKQVGNWPEYPRILLRLARERLLVIPGMSLPGPIEMWENARAEAPVPLDGLLTEFARKELTEEEFAQMGLKAGDLVGNREKLQNAFKRKKSEYDQKQKKGSSR